MKTTLKGKIVIDVDDKNNADNGSVLTLTRVKDHINKGEFTIEWINDDLGGSGEPTLYIKIPLYYESY